MSTLFIDGFEQFKNATNPETPQALQRAGYATAGAGISSLAGRLGGTSISLGDSTIARTVPWADRYFSAGCAAFMYSRNAILTLKLSTGATLACAWVNPQTGVPHLNATLGGSAPAMKVWYYFEIVIDRQSQTMSLLINNRAEVTNIAMPAAALTATSLIVTWGTKTPNRLPGMEVLPDIGGLAYVDDIYTHDADRLGAIAITTRFPTANNSVSWLPAPDAGTNWQIVSSVPPVPLDKNVSSDVIGNYDAYTSSTPLANNNAVVATGICILARKSPLLDAKLGVFIGNDVQVEQRMGVLAIDSNWLTRYQAFYPHAGDTKAGIEATTFGYQVAPP